jgi:hypothetical protein
MYGQFFMLCGPSLLLPALPTMSSLPSYHCSLYHYAPVPLEPYQDA